MKITDQLMLEVSPEEEAYYLTPGLLGASGLCVSLAAIVMSFKTFTVIWSLAFALVSALLFFTFMAFAWRAATTSPPADAGEQEVDNRSGDEVTIRVEVPSSPSPTDGYEFSGEVLGFQVFSRRPIAGKSHIPERIVEIYQGEERVGVARVLNVHSECSWVWSSTTEFEYFLSEQPCDLSVVLRQSYFEERLKRARNIVAVGLASYPVTGEGNTSHERAQNLSKLIAESIPELSFDRSFWALDLGRANTKSTEGEIEEARQRAAVIIGVEEWETTVELSNLIRATLEAVTLDGIILSDYQFSETAVPNRVDIAGEGQSSKD